MTILFLLFSLIFGSFLGYLIVSKHQKAKVFFGHATSYAIYLLIFSMGIAVGTNKQLISEILSIGWKAVVIAISAMMGSVLVALLFYRFIGTKQK